MMNPGPLVPDLTEVMDGSTYSGYDETVKDFGVWLHDLSTAPLPGGVAAAAVAAAMGAALLAKATRVTLRRQAVDEAGRRALEAVLDLARRRQTALVHLAEVDERAYRAVLEGGQMPASSATRREAWLEATEAPIRVAEVCQSLLDRSSQWLDPCWPPPCAARCANRSLAAGDRGTDRPVGGGEQHRVLWEWTRDRVAPVEDRWPEIARALRAKPSPFAVCIPTQ